MSLYAEIARLKNDRDNIRLALSDSGVLNVESHGFDNFAADIRTIVADKIPSNYGKVTYDGSYIKIE